MSTDPDVDSWLVKEGIPSLRSSDGPDVASMLDHFGSKTEARLGWGATWRNWKRRNERSEGRSPSVQVSIPTPKPTIQREPPKPPPTTPESAQRTADFLAGKRVGYLSE